MALTNLSAVEIIAGLFALLALVKIVTIIIKRKAWFNGVVKPVYRKPKVASWIFFILAAVTFYYLILELSIVQIFAVVAFTSLFIGWSMLIYSKDLLAWAKKVYNQKWGPWMWVQIILWLFLIGLVLYEIYI